MFAEAVIPVLLALACVWLVLRVRWLGRRLDHAERGRERDVANLEKAVKAEKQQRRFLELLLDELEDPFLVVDRDLKIRFVNRAARVLFPADSPVGRLLIEVCLERDIVRSASEAVAQDVSFREEIILNERSFTLSTHPISQPYATAGGAWILLHDITLHRETEQIRRDFVANAAHELRTPLSIIRGYLEMFDNSQWLPDNARRPVRKMRSHGERLSRLVDDMLTVSRLESDQGLLNKERFSILDCVNDAIDYLQPLIDENQASISLDFPDPVATLDGDRFYWDQVFLNLLENALKHNPEPGLQLSVQHRVTEQGVELKLKDNGIGIPKRSLPHVFERFYRVVKHRSQEVPGSGLGLSIVKRAIAAHGGEISVQSIPGRKTTFKILIPHVAED